MRRGTRNSLENEEDGDEEIFLVCSFANKNNVFFLEWEKKKEHIIHSLSRGNEEEEEEEQ